MSLLFKILPALAVVAFSLGAYGNVAFALNDDSFTPDTGTYPPTQEFIWAGSWSDHMVDPLGSWCTEWGATEFPIQISDSNAGWDEGNIYGENLTFQCLGDTVTVSLPEGTYTQLYAVCDGSNSNCPGDGPGFSNWYSIPVDLLVETPSSYLPDTVIEGGYEVVNFVATVFFLFVVDVLPNVLVFAAMTFLIWGIQRIAKYFRATRK